MRNNDNMLRIYDTSLFFVIFASFTTFSIICGATDLRRAVFHLLDLFTGFILNWLEVKHRCAMVAGCLQQKKVMTRNRLSEDFLCFCHWYQFVVIDGHLTPIVIREWQL